MTAPRGARLAVLAAVVFAPLRGTAAMTCRPEDLIVAIDIGHSRQQPGAISARGRTEYEFNHDLGGDVLQAVRAEGFLHAFIIDPDGALVDLNERADRASGRGASVLLS